MSIKELNDFCIIHRRNIIVRRGVLAGIGNDYNKWWLR